jgi:hypothetical protein
MRKTQARFNYFLYSESYTHVKSRISFNNSKLSLCLCMVSANVFINSIASALFFCVFNSAIVTDFLVNSQIREFLSHKHPMIPPGPVFEIFVAFIIKHFNPVRDCNPVVNNKTGHQPPGAFAIVTDKFVGTVSEFIENRGNNPGFGCFKVNGF